MASREVLSSERLAADRFDMTIARATEFRERRHFGSLDALRALAVLSVLWHHASGPGSYAGILERGFYGVELFFVISGFLITTLLLRERERGGISLGKFYMRRTLRIFPLYYATLALYTVAVIVFENDAVARSEFFSNLPAFATYTFSWFLDTDPTTERIIFYFAWSLAAEEQFYLMWPQLLARVRVVVAGAFVGVATVVVFVLNLTAWNHPVYDQDLGVRMLRSVPLAIMLGVCLGLALHHRRLFDALAALFGHRASVLATTAIAGLCVSLNVHQSFVALSFAAVVASFVIREDHLLAPLTTLAPIVAIGTVSYGIYMLHSLVIEVVERVLGDGSSAVLVFAVSSIGTYLAAWISFRWYEAPFLRLKDRFASAAVAPDPAPRADAPVEQL